MTAVSFNAQKPIESIREFRKNIDEQPEKKTFLTSVAEFFKEQAITGATIEIPQNQKRKFAKKDMDFLSEHMTDRDGFIANVQKVTQLHFHTLHPQVFQLQVANETPVYLSGKYVRKSGPLLQDMPEDGKDSGYTREFTLGLHSSNPHMKNLLKNLNRICQDPNFKLGNISQSYLYCLQDFIKIPREKKPFLPLKKLPWADLFIMFTFSKEVGAKKQEERIKNELMKRLLYYHEFHIPKDSIQAFLNEYTEESMQNLRRMAVLRLES